MRKYKRLAIAALAANLLTMAHQGYITVTTQEQSNNPHLPEHESKTEDDKPLTNGLYYGRKMKAHQSATARIVK